MTVSYREYAEEKNKFLHSIGDWKCDTSAMDQYGIYRKRYYCTEADSMATWFEVMEQVYETVEAEVEVRGVKVTLRDTVKFLRTEFWSTADPRSKYLYERFR